MTNTNSRAIAIVGVGAILPEAPNAPAFWENVLHKRYSIHEVPPERWPIADYYDPDPKAPDKSYSKIGGWVRGFQFDWKRFRIPPKVAGAMDQSQQWAVTMAAEALADYGYPQRPLDTERTAVVLGTAMGGELGYETHNRIVFPEFRHALEASSDFAGLPSERRQAILAQWHAALDRHIPPITEDSMPGELPNIISGRVANVLNLRGPNFITDAACASSLAALEAAMELLDEYKVDAVLTGGVDRNMGASSFVKFCKIGALSATGTRPFGDGADGFVMGEGAAVLLVKRLADAERDGDKIYAVIRGVGGASDGRGKGITAPNPIGQQLAMRRAWENAGLDPATATLIEAHGTSTRVGDVVEVESLVTVFGDAPRGRIALGSVKSNFGHLKAGAGAAGLLKATLALHHKVLPPTLNARPANPNIDFSQTPFFLNHEAQEWTRTNGAPRRCGVSAYGFGGTNFHVVLEEHVPGLLTHEDRVYTGVSISEQGSRGAEEQGRRTASPPHPLTPSPLRGILALGAPTPKELKEKLDEALQRVEGGWTPPVAAPAPADLSAPERLVIDFGAHDELLDRLQKAQKVMGFDSRQAWTAIQAQGIFRGSGPRPGKIAFLFPGQGSQYVNMGRALARVSPVVAGVIAEADRIMTPILGQPLTAYVFVDSDEPAGLQAAEWALMQTEITQPAMLTLDTAIFKLLAEYGFRPDMVMGHSLGEYAALIAAGIMDFADSLEAAAARGDEMRKIQVNDNGKMAAVLAPYEVVEATLQEIDGYVVPANVNSQSQCVIGGDSEAVEKAAALFQERGYRAMLLPVSHAFHTRIVAPASGPLRQVLDRLSVHPSQLPLVGNLTGEFYPTSVEAIKGILQQQIASPVQWVKGLETLYAAGARCFVEVGPKKALKGFVDDVLGSKPDVISLFTNHPKTGELASFNHALCGLYAAGYGAMEGTEGTKGTVRSVEPIIEVRKEEMLAVKNGAAVAPQGVPGSLDAVAQLLAQALQQATVANPQLPIPNYQSYDLTRPPAGSVVISGTGLGLPGAGKPVMAPDNALRILRGEQFVDLIPERFRKKMLDKRITRLVKSEDGSGHFETIDSPDEVIRLAGRPGPFDLTDEYGVPDKLVEALDVTSQLAMAAGLDALREAGIPLAQTYRRTNNGKYLPDRWLLPESLRDETGVIFASAFPGGDRFVEAFEEYFEWQNRVDQLAMLEDLRQYTADPNTLREIGRRIGDLRETLERKPYVFDRRFIFRILAMGHSQFAEYVGARGPNTQVNAACSSTTQAITIAEDWIRAGRCRRVLVIAADDVTGEHLMEWVGAGFLALGAAATDDRVDEAALPFDRRRHGTLLGMGACALVVESEDAVRERGMRGIVELLSSETRNSAFHGSRLDVDHIAQVMNALVTTAERRYGLHRQAIAPQTVFMSHETYTPARGGSASAEVVALRQTFGEAASEIVVANTKGFTGHPMGVGVEDVIAVKILEHATVPPVPNFKEVDPELGRLNLSRGGRYPVQYALHLAAGFGSQIAMTLIRRIAGSPSRLDNRPQYQRWLDDVTGYDQAETEVVKRVLRVKAQGAPKRTPAPCVWRYGTGPMMRTPAAGDGFVTLDRPLPLPATNGHRIPPAVAPAPEPVTPVETEDGGRKTADGGRPATRATSEDAPSSALLRSQASSDAGLKETTILVSTPPSVSRPSADDVNGRVLQIVADQTGYPLEMLDLDLDLEADLGIDTVKQAETFLAIREAFDIPRRDNLRLRDYPTLGHVVSFVRESRPELAKDGGRKTKDEAQTAVESVRPPSSVIRPSSDEIAGRVLQIVADQTGYPLEMLDLDLDLEADLGIDTVKQAETFLAIREAFDIPRRDNLRLRDYPTLGHVVSFVRESRPELAKDGGRKTEDGGGPAADGQPPSSVPRSSSDEIAGRVLQIVADQTGYPLEMLDLDLDLEADLGIDTVKQAETFLAIREAFDIPRRNDLKLRDYPTLARVIDFVRESRPELAKDGGRKTKDEVETAVESVRPPSPVIHPSSLEAANRLPRRVPTPSLRPSLDLCLPTGVTLDEKSRVVVMLDEGGVGQALVEQLGQRGVQTLSLAPTMTAEALEAQLKTWLAAGPVQGVYWLPALDVEPSLEEMDLTTWRELNRRRVKNLYVAMRALYDWVREPGAFLVAATRLGGLHGYGPEPAVAPLGGAVVGFTKAFKREQEKALVKAVDFGFGDWGLEAGPAEILIQETLSDPGVVEVGYWQDGRYTITLTEQPIPSSSHPGDLQNGVFVVTGAAGGITSAIVADLAAASGGTFYLLDLVAEPDPHSQKIALFRQDKEALKQHLIAEAKVAGERPTPAKIEKQIFAVEREEAALRAIEAVQAAGGAAHYRSLNLLDGPAVTRVVEEIRARHGRMDVLVHAGGLEISRLLPDKDPAQFDLVFDVKADGFFNLLRAAKGMPIGATVAFSSVAGRFGNGGQTDYSAANDLLCKVTSSLQQWRPETRGIVIDWTAWGGIGMATRGSIPKMMEMAGIEMLPPEVGIPTVRRELVCGGRGEIVVAGRLGVLTQEWEETGGVAGGRWQVAEEQVAEEQGSRGAGEQGSRGEGGWLMVEEVKAAKVYGGWEVETILDPRAQPFLYDHQMDGTPILPGAMGTEAFAEVAAALAPGYRVAAVENEQFHLPFKFYRQQPDILYLNVWAEPTTNGDLVAHTMLRSMRLPAKPGLPVQEKLHFTADVRLARAGVEPPTMAFTPPAAETMPITAEEIYRIYFHGPAYQVLERVQVEGARAIGLMAAQLPPDTAPADTHLLMAPRLIELCFQTAGIWEIKTKGVMALPMALQSVTTYRQLEEAGGRRLYAVAQAIDDGASFDAQVVDDTGAVYVTLTGYRTIALEGDFAL